MKSRYDSDSWFLIDFVDSASSPQDSLESLNLRREEHTPDLFVVGRAHT